MDKTPGQVDSEALYWEFDARKKGYAEWKGMPQSERDAFKAVIAHVTPAIRAAAIEDAAQFIRERRGYDDADPVMVNIRALAQLPPGHVCVPEAEPSKTVYGVLATAYRPSQHEASMAAVERHKGATPETDALHKKLVRLSEGPHWIAGKDYCDMRDHAGSLERQRDELRAENERLKAEIDELHNGPSKNFTT